LEGWQNSQGRGREWKGRGGGGLCSKREGERERHEKERERRGKKEACLYTYSTNNTVGYKTKYNPENGCVWVKKKD